MDIKEPILKGCIKNVEIKEVKPKKILQVPVIKGFGEKQELVVKQITIAPPNPAIFRIVQVDKEVTITNLKLAHFCADRATVIIDGFIDKNIIYKTITDSTCDSVGGPVYQFTTRVEFATFVEVKSKEPIISTDQVEILSAVVEGEIEELLDPNPVPEGTPSFAITYNTILEKMVVKIKLKIIRIEHVTVS